MAIWSDWNECSCIRRRCRWTYFFLCLSFTAIWPRIASVLSNLKRDAFLSRYDSCCLHWKEWWITRAVSIFRIGSVLIEFNMRTFVVVVGEMKYLFHHIWTVEETLKAILCIKMCVLFGMHVSQRIYQMDRWLFLRSLHSHFAQFFPLTWIYSKII